ncbi:TPA: hypothetical protein I8Y21_003875 [Klebsiella oxytoca]|uniref:Uncharacterized protein n=1 Tax=Klebsiella oxytoca TaxID=571 RepID=A0AAN5LA46_KLEOX|nr:hypothetical protein [Klebsiella oxytoca]
MSSRNKESIHEFIRDLHISRIALERITVSMLRILSPAQRDIIRELTFDLSLTASETIPESNALLTENEKMIQARIHQLLSVATPHK